VLWVPAGSTDEVIVKVEGATVSDRVTDLDWAGEPASWTDTPGEKFPLPVGVPEIRPVVLFRLSPAGSAPEEIDQVYGDVPPVACRAWE
jgi:hypothetical protein